MAQWNTAEERQASAARVPAIRETRETPLERATMYGRPPKPPRWLSEDEAIEFETPLDRLKQNIEDSLIKPNQEALASGRKAGNDPRVHVIIPYRLEVLKTLRQSLPQEQLVPRGEEVQFETPLSLGLTVEENPRDLGGGVSVAMIEEGSNAERGLGLQPGIQLLTAGGVAVHGMSLEDAVHPIEVAEGKVQLTFFNGSADAWYQLSSRATGFYGLLGPKPSWLSAFLRRLHIKHLAWQWQEGKTPKGRTWSWAFELLDELRESGADEETYSSAACQKASRWQPALSLLNDLRQMPSPVDLGAYRAAMVACDRGGEPLQAMWLLDEMKAQGIEPDAASYDSAIRSCRAFLRGLQTQSSELPDIPDPPPKRRRNKRKLERKLV
eukprot:Skav216294  [mRNA]  locus=scaffold494:85267:93878:- [translate_table: standard]